METPDFTGLHGKKLINAHTAWQKRARKGGIPLEKAQYAGLTTDQAVEVHQYIERQKSIPLLFLTLLNFIVFGWATAHVWSEGEYGLYSLVGNVVILCGMLICIVWCVSSIMRVYNATSARRSYIRHTDERLQSIRHRSAITPLSGMALLLFLAGGSLCCEESASSITPLVAAGLALCIAGAIQFLVAVTRYLIMLRR
ncbi:MAG: hypothetical protein IKS49_03070 [Actinomycetaceae bacterium]|nr:hypothetical protein [Actinomycetaceae bacterium]